MTLHATSVKRAPIEMELPLPRSAAPRINSPKVFGVRPGSPFLYTIVATGKPTEFAAEGLPKGLRLDASTGLITGKLDERGEYQVRLRAKNQAGYAESRLRIVVGDRIALTPPMGWNSWNCWGSKIDQERILAAALAMVKTGLAEHGWSYINIDDGWQGQRNGGLQPNEKFPDMKALVHSIHAMGLKAGIYSTPWVKSFAGYPGGTAGEPGGPVRKLESGWYIGRETYEHEDARQWAQWGFDHLKFDWGPMDLASGERMRDALLACGRDIVFNPTNSAPDRDWAAWTEICECYFLWRRPALGDCDINDSWESINRIGFRMHEWSKYVAPGRWNDPDMLVVGKVGWGKDLHDCKLTRDEQYTHISLWCLLAAPLLLGCDLTQMDDFTLSLLTNDEVLAVNQDPLGKSAERLIAQDGREVWVKKLEDHSLAVGLFNRTDAEATVTANFAELGIDGTWIARDLWKQTDLGSSTRRFEASVPSHGVSLITLRRD